MKCKCELHEIPDYINGGINWYWSYHTRTKCTLELPNKKCWCGRLRSEHLDGHAKEESLNGFELSFERSG